MIASSPSGTAPLNYSAAAEIIESIANTKARQFKRIAWFDADDIRQEVRQKCYLTLGKFDPKISDLRTFLSRCAENRLRDIKRGLLYKHNKPCFRCPLWNMAASKAGKHDCMAFDDKMECDKYARHERYVHIKLSSSHPINLDESRVEDTSFEKAIANADLIEFILKRLTPGQKKIFITFQRSNFDLKALKPKDRTKICEVIVEILSMYQEE